MIVQASGAAAKQSTSSLVADECQLQHFEYNGALIKWKADKEVGLGQRFWLEAASELWHEKRKAVVRKKIFCFMSKAMPKSNSIEWTHRASLSVHIPQCLALPICYTSENTMHISKEFFIHIWVSLDGLRFPPKSRWQETSRMFFPCTMASQSMPGILPRHIFTQDVGSFAKQMDSFLSFAKLHPLEWFLTPCLLLFVCMIYFWRLLMFVLGLDTSREVLH